MLERLYIKNFLLIESLDLSFYKGFSVLTGETGAGKSILLDAIALILGAKLESHMRPLQGIIELEAEFSLTPSLYKYLKLLSHDNQPEFGFFSKIDEEDAILHLQRLIDHDGRSRVKIQHQSATLSQLKALGQHLAGIQNQHTQQYLLEKSRPVFLLDQYITAELMDYDFTQLKYNLQRTYQQLKKNLSEYQNQKILNAQHQEAQQMYLWQHQLLQELSPKAGEWQDIQIQHQLATHAQELLISAQNILNILDDNQPSIFEQLNQINQHLKNLNKYSQNDSQSLFDYVDQAELQLQELAAGIKGKILKLENPEDLERIDQKISDYTRISRNLKLKPEQLFECFQNLENLLSDFEKQSLDALIEKIHQNVLQYMDFANQLQTIRSIHAQNFSKKINYYLEQLAMNEGEFIIEYTTSSLAKKLASLNLPKLKLTDLYQQGEILVELLNTHSGEYHADGFEIWHFSLNRMKNKIMQAYALEKVASGGELSRILLAILASLSQNNHHDYLWVFDEIDAGMSGMAAQAVGRLLSKIAKKSQVISVTHLAQVAAYARQHYKVQKINVVNHIYSEILVLNNEQKIDELTRLVGGHVVSDETKKHATDLVAYAHAQTIV